MVYDLIFKLSEPIPVLLIIHLFRKSREGGWRLKDNEVVDLRSEFVQPNLQPVNFGVEHEKVVDFSLIVVMNRMGAIGGNVVCGAKSVTCVGRELCARGCERYVISSDDRSVRGSHWNR